MAGHQITGTILQEGYSTEGHHNSIVNTIAIGKKE